MDLKCVLSFVILCLIIMFGVDQAQAANCHFDSISDSATFHNITGVPELAQNEDVIWESPTQNIVQAAVVPTPHIRYIAGLRYLARYAYAATETFADFVTLERSDVIQRDVTFTCEDGDNRVITFFFHIDDENNCIPEIEGNSTHNNYTLLKSEAVGEVQVIATFTTVDLDLWPENAALTAVSTRPLIFPVEATLKEGVDHEQVGWTWEIKLSVVWEKALLGEWNFAIVVSDGVWEQSISVVVDVYA